MTPTTYTFTLTVSYPGYLVSQVNGLGLSTGLSNVSVTPPTVSLLFVDVLSDADQSTLSTYMSTYTEPSVPPSSVTLPLVQEALQNPSNVMIILTAQVNNVVSYMSPEQLVKVCTLLGITIPS